MESKKKLKEKFVELEFLHNQLMAEYNDIDQVLQAIGFPCGMASLKQVAGDLITEQMRGSGLKSRVGMEFDLDLDCH